MVLDSVDWLEPLIWAEACRRNGWQSIESPGIGKGYAEALNIWREYIDKLNALRDRKGMALIQIAHTDIRRFDSPEHEPYDRYVIKLQARASALLQEHSDVVLFANYRISVSKSDVGANKKVTRALGSGARHAQERPAFLAKNRYGLPEALPFEWSVFLAAVRQSPDFDRKASTTARFDTAGIESTTAYDILPAGKYRAQIVESEMRVTKNGLGKYLWPMLDILEGPQQGRKAFDQLNLVNANPTTVEIAQRTLSAIARRFVANQRRRSWRSIQRKMPP